MAGLRGAAQGHAAVLRGEHHVGGQAVGASVHVDDVTRLQVVGAQQRCQAGHRPVRALARVGVVARRGGVLVAHQARVVDVEVAPGIGHEEALVAGVTDRDGAAGGVDRRADAQQRGVAHRLGVRRPGGLPAPMAVHRQTGGHRGPARAGIGGDLQRQHRVGHAVGVHAPQLDAVDEGTVAGADVDQIQPQALPAAEVHRAQVRDRGVRRPGGRAHVEAGRHRHAVDDDVELALPDADIARVQEVQHQLVLPVRGVELVAHRVAHAAVGVGVAAVYGLRRRIRTQRTQIEGGAVVVAVRAAAVDAALGLRQPVVHRTGVGVGLPGVHQEHRVVRQQPGRAPGHRHRLAELVLFQPVRAEDLDQLARARGGVGGVAVGAQVDAVARRAGLAHPVAVGVTAVDGRRARQQLHVVVAAEVARHTLDAHRVGHDLDVAGQVVQRHRQALAADAHHAQAQPVAAGVLELPAARAVGCGVVLVDRRQPDGRAVLVVEGVVGVGGRLLGVGPRHGDAVVARAQPVEGPAGGGSDVAGVDGRRQRIAVAADRQPRPRARGLERRVAVVDDAHAAIHDRAHPADGVVGAVGVDELRVGGDAVAVEADFVEPVGAVGEGPVLPVRDLALRTQHEQVVVRLEAALAVGVDVDGMSAATQLQDVVAQQDGGAVALHLDGVGRADGRDGVVLHQRDPAGAGCAAGQHAGRAVAFDDVVMNPVVVAVHAHAGRGVAIDAVAVDIATVDGVDAVACVGPHAVVARDAVVDVDAVAAVAPAQVAHGLRAVVHADAVVAVGPRLVALHQHPAVVAVDAVAVVERTVALHQRDVGSVVAAVVDLDAVAAVTVDRVVQHARAHAVDVDAIAAVAEDFVAFDQRVRARDEHAPRRVVPHPRAADHREVVARAQRDAAVRVAPHPAVHDAQPVAILATGRVHAVIPARQPQPLQRHIVRTLQLDDVGTGVGVAAVEGGLAIAGALDRHPGVLHRDDDVGPQAVQAGVDQHDVAGLQIVGVQDRAQRGLGLVGRQAVVGVVARRRGEFVALGAAVVDVVETDRRDDGERAVRAVRHRRRVDGGDADLVVGADGIQRRVDQPREAAVVGFVRPQRREARDRPAPHVDVDVAGEATGTPTDLGRAALAQPLAAVRREHGDVLDRAARGLRRVAVGTDVDVAAARGRLQIVRIACTAAVDGWRRGIGDQVGRRQHHRQAADGRSHRRQPAAAGDAAVDAAQVEVVVAPVLRQTGEAQDTVAAVRIHEQRVGDQAVEVGRRRAAPGSQRVAIDPLPQGQRDARVRDEDVEVRLEADLAVRRDVDRVADRCLQDVVEDLRVAGVVLDTQGVAGGLDDGVVDHRQAGPGADHAARRVSVDEVVAQHALRAARQRTADADRVRVHDVADRVGRVDPDAVLDVGVDAVGLGHAAVPELDAVRVAVDDVRARRDVAVAVQADRVAAGVPEHRIAGHQHAVVGRDAVAQVLVHPVAVAGRQVGVADGRGRAANPVADIQAVTVQEDLVALHDAGTRARQVHAPVAVMACDVVGDLTQDPGIEVEAAPGIAVGQGMGQREDRSADLHAIVAVAEGHQVVEDAERRGRGDVEALQRMAAGRDVDDVQAVGAGVRVDAALRVLQREVLDGDEVGVVEVDQRAGAIARDGREQARDLRRIHRACDREREVPTHARACEQADVVQPGDRDRVDHRVIAAVDVHGIAGAQFVRAEDVDRVRLGRRGQLARVTVVADGVGREGIPGVAGVVDVVGLPVLGNRECLLAAVDHGAGLDQRDLDPQSVGPEVDAAGLRDPDEVAVVRR